jgi:hypothetical protein
VSTERVKEAAVRFRGRTYFGTSHKVAVMSASLALDVAPATVWSTLRRENFGFVTTRGRFVSRALAWIIAKRAGQLRWDRSRPGVTPELHSEDMR